MVNTMIYLEQQHNAKELVEQLLTMKLIASASIDENNVSYRWIDDKMQEVIHTVITVQTKSLLFKDIKKVIDEKYGAIIPMNSIPIVASNTVFDESILDKTLPV